MLIKYWHSYYILAVKFPAVVNTGKFYIYKSRYLAFII